MRFWVIALLAACWTSSAAPPPAEPAQEPPPRRTARVVEPEPPVEEPPPAVPPPSSPLPACTPAGCDARIIGISIVNSSVEVTIGVGANHGVTPAWTATLLDPNNQPIPQAVLTITRVDATRTKVMTTFPVSHLQASPRVRLAP